MTLRPVRRRLGLYLGLGLVVVVLGLFGWLWLDARSDTVCGIGCGELHVVVRGFALDKQTGMPLKDVHVVALSGSHWTEDEILEDLERQDEYKRELDAQGVEERNRWVYPGCAQATTDASGYFELHVGVPYSVSLNGVGRVISESGHEPRKGVRLLRFVRPGGAPTRLPIPDGTWAKVADDDVHATWHVGDIGLPR